jgi:xylulose-5-phosphate/fructose-6-phosphate phosphoketolase
VYLPPDANCFLSTVDHCLKSKNCVNLIIGSKQPTIVYLSPEQAAEHCRRGVGIWDFASTDMGNNPDVIIAGIGVEVSFEVVKAAELLRRLEPALRVRVVNVTDLMVLAAEKRHPHSIGGGAFNEIFTHDKPVCINYHGYATELQGLLFGRPGMDRVTVEGYREEGSTTTPFDMMLANRVSRFDVARRAIKAGSKVNTTVKESLEEKLRIIEARVREVKAYIISHGEGLFHLAKGFTI